jgi:general secretion pathway protein D
MVLALHLLGHASTPASGHFAHRVTKRHGIPSQRTGGEKTLHIRARTFFANGDLEEASAAIDTHLGMFPGDGDALVLREKIREAIRKCPDGRRKSTRIAMLNGVDEIWEMNDLPAQYTEVQCPDQSPTELENKLAKITIPQAHFINLPISQAIEAITELSIRYDVTTDKPGEKGINIVLMCPSTETEPKITLNLRNISLERLLFYVSQAAGYRCEYAGDAVVIGADGTLCEQLETRFFPISRATVIRLTGRQGENSDDIAAEECAIKNFFTRAGVEFGGTGGSNLAFDGSQLIVTHSLKNLRRIERILQKYSQVRQVEIEAKFLEVTQGSLDELAFRWNVANRFDANRGYLQTGTGAPDTDNLRTLAQAFAPTASSRGHGKIVVPNTEYPINNEPPNLPGQINIGTSSLPVPLGSFLGVVDRAQINLMIRALEQQSSSDLMSAPKLTVLSGKTANIIVAKELRYPQSYGETHSEVGSGSSINNTSSAGVTITAGTPRDFVTRNIGVEMRVTPTVEDDQNISLKLEPKVTEFDGCMEYGGMSVAVAGGNVVYVPSGFYQPIFSTREIHTEVTVQNGWTVVMGGLTREEIKEVRDKVPLLGDIPLLGKLFRSKGQTTQKRNLLIFVTARTISSNGAKFQKSHQSTHFREMSVP